VGRLQDYESILDSAGRMQASIARVLEAKAGEARINQEWITRQLKAADLTSAGDVHSLALEMHDQLIDVLDGLTKMETGMVRNLKVLLGEEDEVDGEADAFGSGRTFG
jgi:hypothetical protein